MPADEIRDYSPHRRGFPIGDVPGVSFTPEGKLGSARAFNGIGPRRWEPRRKGKVLIVPPPGTAIWA